MVHLLKSILRGIRRAARRGRLRDPSRTNFDDSRTWHCRDGILLEPATDGEKGRCLHLRGMQPGALHYALTALFALRPGGLYRVTGALKVGSARPAHPPYLSVGFVAASDPRGQMGAMNLPRYDLRRGEWQALEGEFRVPRGITAGRLALLKGALDGVALEAWMAGVSVAPIAALTAPAKWHLDEEPESLKACVGIHPRLHMTAERLEELSGRVASEPKYAALARGVRHVADRGVADGPPAYVRDDGETGVEQQWQMRVGEMIPHLALVWLLSGEERYLNAARDFMVASCGYETWGLGARDGLDLAAGHQLYGLALGYDWLHADLDEPTRRTVGDCLAARGQRMFEGAATGQARWSTAYKQNHNWVNVAGLAAAALALYGEREAVGDWLALALDDYRTVMDSLGPDGASHEGASYWTYGVEYMLKFMDLARDLLDEDMFAGSEWFSNAAGFRLYSSLPRNSWRGGAAKQTLMGFGDGSRFDDYGPDYQLHRLAAEYRQGQAQWLASALDGAGLCNTQARFLNLLWYDPSVPSDPPDSLSTFRRFDDLDLVFMRSDWSGAEAMCAFKCGPHIGHHGLARFSSDPGGGHVHPDAGSLQVFAHGDWLLSDEGGYALKVTAHHNTLLVNGIGQTGEGAKWFSGGALCAEKRGACILRSETGPEIDFVIGDIAEAYRREAGLRRFVRHIYYLKPSCWVIVDELAAERPSTFEAFFHSDFPFEQVSPGSYVAGGQRGQLVLTVLQPATAQCEAFVQQVRNTNGRPRPGGMPALKVRNPEPAEELRSIYVLHARPAGTAPGPPPELREHEGLLRLHVPVRDRDWAFELRDQRADPSMPILVGVLAQKRRGVRAARRAARIRSSASPA